MAGPSSVRVRRVAAARFLSVRLRLAVLVTLGMAAIAVGGISASSASALDTMYLNNQTTVPFTQESYCLFIGIPASICAGTPWAEGAVLPAGMANPGIPAFLQAIPPNTTHFSTTWSPSGSSNYFTVLAIDPSIGPAFVQCTGSVPGFDCYVVDDLFAYLEQASSSTSTVEGSSPPLKARFWSGVAPISGRDTALVPVAAYSSQRRGTVHERVVLRSSGGRLIGRGEKTVRFNQQANIKVRLPSKIARTVTSITSIKVHASVTDVDATAGTGQATTLTISRLTPAVRRLLHLPAG